MTAFADADARIFVAVARAGSFAAAAAQARVTPSAVSKAIARLEAALGVRLLVRTTRSLHLSAEGITFRDRCEQAFALLSEALDEVSTAATAVTGTVRIGAPPVFGTYLLPPVIARVRAAHPRLCLELVSTMRPADLVDRRLDFLIVVGPLPDSSFVARPLGYGQFVTVAAPSTRAPKRLADLVNHPWLVYTRPDGRDAPFVFDSGPVEPGEVAARSDDMHHLAALAIAGAGIAQLPLFTVARELEAGTLIRLLAAHEPEPKLASLVFPSGKSISRRARIVIDELVRPESELPGTSARRR